jgi:hypothetical protein
LRFQNLAFLSIAKRKSFVAISLTLLTNHLEVLQKGSLLKGCAAAPHASSLVSPTSQPLDRSNVRCIACFLRLPTACPPRCALNRSFLSLVNHFPAAPLAASLVSLTGQPLARRAACYIARFFLLPMPCSRHRSLYPSFLSFADDLPVVPLAESLHSFSCGCPTCSAAH